MTDYPNASSYLDRHGRRRWRFRRAGRTVPLPGQPGEPAFESAYLAAIEGRPAATTAHIVRHPAAAAPQSLRAAWRLVATTVPEWRRLSPSTRARQERIADLFLKSPVAPGTALIWGDVPMADLRRRHLRTLLASMSDTPHAARHLLVVIRRMILVAMDHEWIEIDPSYKLQWRPDYTGWKSWPDDIRARFEARWPIGTTPRLAYALALWLGNRRSDIVSLTPSAIDGNCIHIQQKKTGRRLILEITPMLREVLDATDLSGPTILKTQAGAPFSSKSLTGRMADWTRAAGIPPGYTLHGLRKAFGRMLAEGGASTRQIMEALGVSDIQHAELYSRAADQRLLAKEGMEKVVKLIRPNKG